MFPDFAIVHHLSSPNTFFLTQTTFKNTENIHRHRHTYIFTYRSHDHVRLQVTYHDGSHFPGFSSLWRLLFHRGNDVIREGRREGEERKNPQKTHRSQFWYDVSHDEALFCETYFALCMYHASGVQCRGICLRYITLAICLPCHVAAGYATPAVRHQKETRNAFACQALQRDVWRSKKKRTTVVFGTAGQTIK